MASKKITLVLDTELLDQVDTIAEAKDQSRTQLIADLLADYVAENIEKAKHIQSLQQQLAQAQAELKD